MNNISINDVETKHDPVSGRTTFRYELAPGAVIEANSIVELVKKLKEYSNSIGVEDHGQGD